MKKGHEWLTWLTKKEQEQFLSNCNKKKYLNQTFTSFEFFLIGAFLWMESPEDEDYWMEISRRTEPLKTN